MVNLVNHELDACILRRPKGSRAECLGVCVCATIADIRATIRLGTAESVASRDCLLEG